MAITYVTNGPTNLVCVDADVNGVATAAYPIGYTAWARDTNKTYRTYDGTHWLLADISGIASGRKTVTTHGTAVALATSTPCKAVKITALSGNTNRVVYGGADVVAAVGTGKGIPLYVVSGVPQTSGWIPCSDLANIYIDSITDGEGVMFVYLT